MLKQNLFTWLFACLLLVTANLGYAEEKNPYKLVSGVAAKTFDRIKAERSQIDENPELLRTIMEEELLPYIDYRFAGLKVLGKHYKTVPKDKLPEYLQVFRDYLITTYALVMAQYDDQIVEFEPGKAINKEKMVSVRALMKSPGRPDVKLAFKVRRNKKTNEWRAFDMVAEGISVLNSKQSELESIIRQQGIDAVIDIMKKKNAQPITLKKEVKETA